MDGERRCRQVVPAGTTMLRSRHSGDPSRPTEMSPHSCIFISPPLWRIWVGVMKRGQRYKQGSRYFRPSPLRASARAHRATIRPIFLGASASMKACAWPECLKGERARGEFRSRCKRPIERWHGAVSANLMRQGLIVARREWSTLGTLPGASHSPEIFFTDDERRIRKPPLLV